MLLSPLAERYAAIGRKQGMEKGIAIGVERGIAIGESRNSAKSKAETIISILDVKFGEISETVCEPLYAITDNNRLQYLVRFAVKCESFEEFYKELKSAK